MPSKIFPFAKILCLLFCIKNFGGWAIYIFELTSFSNDLSILLQNLENFLMASICIIDLIITIILIWKKPSDGKILCGISLVLSILTLVLYLHCTLFKLFHDYNWVPLAIIVVIMIAISIFDLIQAKDNNDTVQVQSSQKNSLDNLIKYKELLDMGAITEEEFNKMKKQILNQDR